MTEHLFATILLSVTSGVAAGLWILAAGGSIRRRSWWRCAAQIIMVLASLSSTIALIRREFSPGFEVPRIVSTLILEALFLVPALMVYRDQRRTEEGVARLKAAAEHE